MHGDRPAIRVASPPRQPPRSPLYMARRLLGDIAFATAAAAPQTPRARPSSQLLAHSFDWPALPASFTGVYIGGVSAALRALPSAARPSLAPPSAREELATLLDNFVRAACYITSFYVGTSLLRGEAASSVAALRATGARASRRASPSAARAVCHLLDGAAGCDPSWRRETVRRRPDAPDPTLTRARALADPPVRLARGSRGTWRSPTWRTAPSRSRRAGFAPRRPGRGPS